eukprot:COSAG02_NODE_3090_length_7388_cov_7.725614_10_plen_72_part_01
MLLQLARCPSTTALVVLSIQIVLVCVPGSPRKSRFSRPVPCKRCAFRAKIVATVVLCSCIVYAQAIAELEAV